MLGEKFVLVTDDYHVFVSHANSLRSNQTYRSVYFEQNAIIMSDYWPKLWKKVRFDKIKNYSNFNAFTMWDLFGEYFCIITKWKKSKPTDLCYDIRFNEKFDANFYNGHYNQIILSSSELAVYYSLHKSNTTTGLQLTKFQMVSQHMRSVNGIRQMNPWRDLCRFRARQLYSSETPCEVPFYTEVFKGFVFEDTIYLFGPGEVTSIPLEVYTNPGSKHYINVTVFQKFFQCEQFLGSAAIPGRPK